MLVAPLLLRGISVLLCGDKVGNRLVINIDQEWEDFLLYLAAGLNLLRTYVLLGNAQPQPTH